MKLCPELVPPEIRKSDPQPADLASIIVAEACGLRPMRKGGPRIEVEHLAANGGAKVPVVYNYGCVVWLVFMTRAADGGDTHRHGAQGYMASFGSADRVVELLKTIQ